MTLHLATPPHLATLPGHCLQFSHLGGHPCSFTTCLHIPRDTERGEGDIKPPSPPCRHPMVTCPHRACVNITVYPASAPVRVRPHLRLARRSAQTHIVWLDRPDLPDPPDLTGRCLILFIDSHMFSFYNRISLHLLSSSTFYLRLDPWSSILISVTYPCLSDSGSH